MPLSLVSAELAGIVLESLLVGVELVFFGCALYVLTSKRGVSFIGAAGFNHAAKLLVLLIVICSAGLAHWAIDVYRVFNAFVYDVALPGGPLFVFANLADPTRLADTILYQFESFLGDAFVVYRMYLVCDRNKWTVLLPCLTLIGTLVCDVGLVYEARLAEDQTQAFTEANDRWALAVFSLSISTNLSAFLMISYRIWRVNRDIKVILQRGGSAHLSRALRAVFEGTFFYLGFTLAIAVSYLAKSNFYATVASAGSPSVGIGFCFMIIRTEWHLSQSTGNVGASMMSSTFGGTTRTRTSALNKRLGTFLPASRFDWASESIGMAPTQPNTSRSPPGELDFGDNKETIVLPYDGSTVGHDSHATCTAESRRARSTSPWNAGDVESTGDKDAESDWELGGNPFTMRIPKLVKE